jgi:acyl-coenzyme A synthetase/AMP-(fatty) acid ligase
MLSEIDSGPPPPCPAPYNLAADVLAAGEAHPGKVALSVIGPEGAQDWTYGALAAEVRGCGAALLALGLTPGQRVLMRLGNSVDFPVLFLGAIAAGLVPVPTSAQLTGPEIARMAAAVDPALIVAAKGVALPEAPGCPVIGMAALRGRAEGALCDYALGAPDRLAYLIFTSGTSGRARAVAHAHRALRARRMMWRGWYGLGEGDRVLHAGAFNWTYTLGAGLLDPWAAGATALIPAEGTRPAELPGLLRAHRATIFAAVPGVYRQMLRAMPDPGGAGGARPLPALRHGLSAGEALPPALREAWRAATGTEVHEAFGMSECSTFISGCPERPAPAGACGYPQPGRRIAVLGEDGRPVPRGAPGLLAVHRSDPGLFLGYFGEEEETRARFQGDWFVTGDVVTMADDGAIAYVGRSDDLMNAGGFRVSPLEVEAALATHPAIADCAVTEIRVRADTSVIAAFYVASQPVDKAELESFAAARLARYKQPRLYIAVDAIPRNANGKINRRLLRQIHEAPDDQA